MTTYTELAKDPQAFDTELARLHAEIAKAQSMLKAKMDAVFRAAGARRKSTRQGLVWDASYDVAHGKVLDSHPELIAAVHEARKAWRDLENGIQAMDRAYTGWTRFFPSVTKSQPHIHRSLHCRTLHPTTQMSWAPQLSGKTDEVAVAELDEALCSVCFPDAPVALHNYQSKRSQAERDERQAAKTARDAAKAAKTLTEAEQFRTAGRFSARITTVAACKELIRKAVEEAVRLDYFSTAKAASEWQGDADSFARVRRNSADILEEARKDAAEARRVLIARETVHPGWGMNEREIDVMMARKDKSARKEYGL